MLKMILYFYTHNICIPFWYALFFFFAFSSQIFYCIKRNIYYVDKILKTIKLLIITVHSIISYDITAPAPFFHITYKHTIGNKIRNALPNICT